MKKLEAIQAIVSVIDKDDLIVCCNGMIGRELYTVRDRPSNFYMIGSMGLGLSIGLGLAVAQPKRRIFVLDGDGNVLMGMNALASIASEQPLNLVHLVLDNHAHASTGGQRTISNVISLESIAKAAGYKACYRVEGVDALQTVLQKAVAGDGPVMVLGVVEPGNVTGIGRVEPSPPELTRRFMKEACR